MNMENDKFERLWQRFQSAIEGNVTVSDWEALKRTTKDCYSQIEDDSDEFTIEAAIQVYEDFCKATDIVFCQPCKASSKVVRKAGAKGKFVELHNVNGLIGEVHCDENDCYQVV